MHPINKHFAERVKHLPSLEEVYIVELVELHRELQRGLQL